MVFDSPDAAERAIKEVQGFNLFEKPMVLQYAKTKSDATVQLESSEAEFEAHKRRRLAEKGMHRFYKAIASMSRWKSDLTIGYRTETSTPCR